jgi:hypothetical protein
MRPPINPNVVHLSQARGADGLPVASDEVVDFDNQTYTMRDESGRLVTMDMSVSDVHIDTAAANVLLGYKNQDFIADLVAPVITKSVASGQYYIADTNDQFQLVQGAVSAPGAAVKEISPRLAKDQFATQSNALASFVPTEVEAAADSPIRPGMLASKRVWQALMLGREYRVATKLTNAASYAAANKITLGAGAQWNTGTGGDPVANLLALVDAATTQPTHIIMSYRCFMYFFLNPNVRAYTQYKDNEQTLPEFNTTSTYRFRGLPPIIISTLKYRAADGTLQYVWGNNPVLVRVPTGGMASDGEDIATMATFRWVINAEDARVQDGISVRSFYMNDRGPNGGRKFVVNHYDDEKLLAADVGGIITGVIQ